MADVYVCGPRRQFPGHLCSRATGAPRGPGWMLMLMPARGSSPRLSCLRPADVAGTFKKDTHNQLNNVFSNVVKDKMKVPWLHLTLR